MPVIWLVSLYKVLTLGVLSQLFSPIEDMFFDLLPIFDLLNEIKKLPGAFHIAVAEVVIQ